MEEGVPAGALISGGISNGFSSGGDAVVKHGTLGAGEATSCGEVEEAVLETQSSGHNLKLIAFFARGKLCILHTTSIPLHPHIGLSSQERFHGTPRSVHDPHTHAT